MHVTRHYLLDSGLGIDGTNGTNFAMHFLLFPRPMTAPQMSRCDQGHKGGTAANHTLSGGPNTRSGLFSEHSILMYFKRLHL